MLSTTNPPAVRTWRGRLALTALLVLWGLALVAGGAFLLRYESTPGATRGVIQRWPAEADFQPTGGSPALVIFLHPHCPCSRATIEELNRLLVRKLGQVEVFAVFVKPVEAPPDWEQTDQWRSVSRIPGAHVISDEGGIARALFGASTSGETLLFDKQGRLIFHGGITGSRGHAGDNAAADALAARIQDPTLGFCVTKVFGCALAAD